MPMVECEAPGWEERLLQRVDELYVDENVRLQYIEQQLLQHRDQLWLPGRRNDSSCLTQGVL